MKKPEVTVNTTFPLKRSTGVDRVAVNDMGAWEIREAYDEMLDALMKARESHIEHVIEMPEPPREDEVLESIDNALIKAGCTDE